MAQSNPQTSNQIRRFIDHYGSTAATMPVIEEEIIENNSGSKKIDALSQPSEPKVVATHNDRPEPSAAMLRTFELQQEISRRRGVK